MKIYREGMLPRGSALYGGRALIPKKPDANTFHRGKSGGKAMEFLGVLGVVIVLILGWGIAI